MIKLKGLGAQLKDGALLQASFATYLSFRHLYLVATMVGQTGASGWLYPPSVDLLTYSAYRRIKAARPGESRKAGVAAFLLASTASLAANVIGVLPPAMQAALAANLAVRILVGAWPPVAVVVSMLLGHTGAERGPVPAEAAEPQEEQPGEQQPRQRPLALVPDTRDTPGTRDTPEPQWPTQLPEQSHPGFYAAVLRHVTARHPVDSFQSVEAFSRFVIELLVSHGYSKCHEATIRRALKRLDSVAV